jgi:PAS domain S-box-containing protein
LEMQNEALRQAQSSLGESRDHYADLYDFAPVGYITPSSKGMIDVMNHTAATLMGAERKKLSGHRFATLVSPEDRNRWMQYFMTVMKRDGKSCVELALQRSDGIVAEARMDCERIKSALAGRRCALA